MHFTEYAEGAKSLRLSVYRMAPLYRQAKLVRPLALGLLDGKKQNVQKRLVKAVENEDIASVQAFIYSIHSSHTQKQGVDVAYKMLENEDLPVG